MSECSWEKDDRKVLDLVKKGQKEAFRHIVERYKKPAYYLALSLVRNQEDALDLSQEAFVKAFRKIKSFDLNKEFFPLLSPLVVKIIAAYSTFLVGKEQIKWYLISLLSGRGNISL